MYRKYFGLSIAAALSLTSQSILAAPICSTSPAPAACDDVLIKQLYVTSAGVAYVAVDATVSTLNCVPAGGIYLTLAHQAGSEKLYSLFLTAHHQQQRINIRVNDGSGGCTILSAVSVK